MRSELQRFRLYASGFSLILAHGYTFLSGGPNEAPYAILAAFYRESELIGRSVGCMFSVTVPKRSNFCRVSTYLLNSSASLAHRSMYIQFSYVVRYLGFLRGF